MSTTSTPAVSQDLVLSATTTSPLEIAQILARGRTKDLVAECRARRIGIHKDKAVIIDRLASDIAIRGGHIHLTLTIPPAKDEK